MLWLAERYFLHALFVLAMVAWSLSLERKIRTADVRIRVLVRMIDRDMDDIRDDVKSRLDTIDARLESIQEALRK